MKILMVLLSGASGLMLLSTMICGLWLRANGAPSESVSFHMGLGVATVILVLAALGVLTFAAWRA